ncbi:MAG: hypothetical protein PHH60_04015 [Candidatus Margulisbacteria bacterium]|nr:hypothetical protein [Candidatus Margulisiibacteriota bacterium]
MKKCLLGLLIILTLAAAAFAVPQYINYQGVLRDSAGNLVTGSKQMTFKLYDAVSGGTLKWSLTIPAVAVNNGLYTIKLGPLSGDALGSGSRWLEVTVGSTTLTPRLEILAVAYAVTSDTAGYSTLSGSATTAATADLLDGRHAAASGANIIPFTNSHGTLDASVIPAAGINVAHANMADYATISGTATNAADASHADIADNATNAIAAITATNAHQVDNIHANATATGGQLYPLDAAGRISGVGITAEATSGPALYINGTIGAVSTEGTTYGPCGMGVILSGAKTATVNNTYVTKKSIIFITIADTTWNYGNKNLRVKTINDNTSFVVSTVDDTIADGANNMPFYYLIIN